MPESLRPRPAPPTAAESAAAPPAARLPEPSPRDRARPGALRVEGLALDAQGRRLVDIDHLALPAGGVTMVMGQNGAGKSLFLRLIHGLIAPSHGWISWGEVPCGPATRATQALVFQKPVLLRRSVAANVDFVLKARGLSRAARRERCAEMLARVGLEAHARQPARLLSGGEQQRLALARALAIRPQVLLLDEATASLDPASVLAIERIVTEAAEAGTKVIFITHDIGQARRLADDVAFLHRGRIAEHRPAAQFFLGPQSESALAYLEGRILL